MYLVSFLCSALDMPNCFCLEQDPAVRIVFTTRCRICRCNLPVFLSLTVYSVRFGREISWRVTRSCSQLRVTITMWGCTSGNCHKPSIHQPNSRLTERRCLLQHRRGRARRAVTVRRQRSSGKKSENAICHAAQHVYQTVLKVADDGCAVVLRCSKCICV